MESHELVFITGFARSGTTLLASALGRVPGICSTPETVFFEEIYRKGKPYLWNDALERGMKNRYASDLGLENNLLEIAKSASTWDDFFRSCLNVYQQKKKPAARVICEKSPHHLMHIKSIKKEYPKSKIIIIVRDPRDTISSLKRVPWAHNSVIRHAIEWRFRTKYLREITQIYRDILVVRYEDIVTNPEKEINSILDNLGVMDKFANVENIDDLGGVIPGWELDWKKKASQKIDASSIGIYRKNFSEKEELWVRRICGSEAALLGYRELLCEDRVDILDNKAFVKAYWVYRNMRIKLLTGNFYDDYRS